MLFPSDVLKRLSFGVTYLTEAERRPEAAPAALLNEFVTPAVALSLGDEKQLKQAVQYRRKKIRPADPPTAGDVLITDQWTRTMDGAEWYLGQVTLDEDVAHIFATEENLKITVNCDVAIVPCGHCVCSACMQNITSAVGSSSCPVCMADINTVLRLHFAA